MAHADRDRSEHRCIAEGCDRAIHAFVKVTEDGIRHLHESDDPQTRVSDAMHSETEYRQMEASALAAEAEVERIWCDFKALAEQVADTRRRAGAAEAMVAQVEALLYDHPNCIGECGCAVNAIQRAIDGDE